MRQKIAAGNWKMNLSYQEGEELLKNLLESESDVNEQVIIGAPFPYLKDFSALCAHSEKINVAAQNCHHLMKGAFTGEGSVSMLLSIGVSHVIIGHSEWRTIVRKRGW